MVYPMALGKKKTRKTVEKAKPKKELVKTQEKRLNLHLCR
jgi:hypothetical protein